MRTIPQLFEDSVKLFADNIFIHEKSRGIYNSISYKSVKADVYAFAAGLIRSGIKKNDRVALLSEGRSEWLISELAILYTGAIAVPLSVKINEPSELLFRLKHSGCRYIIVSDQQLEKLREVGPELKDLETVILLDTTDETRKNEVFYADLLSYGKENLSTVAQDLEQRWKTLKEDDLANISYTSGTTADPKGIMLTQRNYTANVEQANSLFDVPQWYTTLLILSWDHSFAHTVGLYVLMKNGGSFAVVESGNTPMESLRNIPKNIKEIRPVFQLSVPALARSFKKNIEAGIRSKGKRTEKIFNHALKLSHRYHGNGWDTRRSVLKKPLVWFYDKLLFSKIRENFGGRLKFFIGGGALLDIELQKFFYAIGIPMYQGYGLTEASPIVSSNTPGKHKLGSSGSVVKNLEIKILDEDGKTCPVGEKGEIVVKGENVMKGYWNNPLATKETLKKAWLFTGDLGYLDKDGFLYVMGRFKSLLIGNDGEKYSPEGIEEMLVDGSKYFEQCMLYNNQNSYTVGVFVLNKSALLIHLKEKGLATGSEESVIECLNLIKNELDQYAAGGEFENMFPLRWLPAAVGILTEPFTEDNGLINSTIKMVRSKVTERHASTIEYLYTPSGKPIESERNKEAINTLFIS